MRSTLWTSVDSLSQDGIACGIDKGCNVKHCRKGDIDPGPWKITDCDLRQGARHLKGTYKGNFLYLFVGFFRALMGHMGPARALEEQ